MLQHLLDSLFLGYEQLCVPFTQNVNGCVISCYSDPYINSPDIAAILVTKSQSVYIYNMKIAFHYECSIRVV